MDVNNVNSQYSATSNTSNTNSTNSSSAVNPGGNLDKNAFLQILTTELSNQDPLNTQQDDTQYVAQLAQFSALEQTQNLNTTSTQILTSQKLTEGTLMINKPVEIQQSDSSTITGTVKSVRVEGSNVYVVTDSGDKYDIDQVVQVGDE